MTPKTDGGGSDHDAIGSLISAEARALGLTLDADAGSLLVQFGTLFLKWNASINLAAVKSSAELVERHFVDAFAASRFVPQGARVIDVGTGGGLPALPLALVRSDVTIDLFEPIQKKGAFLRTAIRELALGPRVTVHPESVESPVAASLRGAFDVAMSRATLEPPAWLALGKQLMRPGAGRILVFATVHSEGDLPIPLEALSYGRNRRLLSYGGAL